MNDYLHATYKYRDGNLYRLKGGGGKSTGSIAGWTTTCNGRLYKKISINYKTYYLHQIIFMYHHGFIPSYIDHIDGNSLNNDINNLRQATQSQNVHNASKRSNNTSGYKGVCWVKKKWRAAIMVNGKNISLGAYDCIEDAAAAYQRGAIKFYGEFART